MKSKYMTLEKYAATLKVGDEVTIEYHSMAGDRQTYVNIQPKPREIDRIHQQILYAPRLANHQHSKR